MTKNILIFLTLASFSYASKHITVDLSKQKLYAEENGEMFMNTRISSGKKGHRTPSGHFSIFYKSKDHISTKYPQRKNGDNGGAKMPNAMFITKGGIAIHGGYLPRYPASHGCIRISPNKADKLFDWAEIGTRVNVVGRAHGGYHLTRKKRNHRKKHRTTHKKGVGKLIIEKEYYDRYTSWTEDYYDPKNTTLVGNGKEFDYLYE